MKVLNGRQDVPTGYEMRNSGMSKAAAITLAEQFGKVYEETIYLKCINHLWSVYTLRH